MRSVAIAVVNWNTKPLIQLLVRSIRRYTPEPHALYVFDNGSRDGSAAWLARQSDVTLVRVPENAGHAGGLNALARTVTEDLFLCLDSDAHVYRDGWLSPLVSHLDDHVRAVGYQSGFLGDPRFVSASLHAFCMLVDLRPFRERGVNPDFSSLIEDGRQVVDTAGQVSLALKDWGYETKVLMTDEETKAIRPESRRYPGQPGRVYHDGYGDFFIHHLFFASRPSLRRFGLSEQYRFLRAAYEHVDPTVSPARIVGGYFLRRLLTPGLRVEALRSIRSHKALE